MKLFFDISLYSRIEDVVTRRVDMRVEACVCVFECAHVALWQCRPADMQV